MNDFLDEPHSVPLFDFREAVRAQYHVHASVLPSIIATAYFHDDDFPLRMHSHSFYEINIVTEGEGVHYVGEQRFPIKTGDFYIIPPHLEHGYTETKKLKIFHVLLSDKFFNKYNIFLKEFQGFSLFFNTELSATAKKDINLFPSIPQNDFIYYLYEIRKLNEMCKDDESGKLHETSKCLKILNLIADLCKIVSSAAPASPDAFIDTPSLFKAVSFIEKNYNANFTINDLCKISNMSRSTLLKQFNELCKCSPTAYLLNIRIEKACKKLKTSNHSIARIAQDCGFYDSSHFCKTFLQVMKMLPKDYRNQYKESTLS